MWEDEGLMIDFLVNRGYEIVYPDEHEIKEGLRILYDLKEKGLLNETLTKLKEEGVARDRNR